MPPITSRLTVFGSAGLAIRARGSLRQRLVVLVDQLAVLLRHVVRAREEDLAAFRFGLAAQAELEALHALGDGGLQPLERRRHPGRRDRRPGPSGCAALRRAPGIDALALHHPAELRRRRWRTGALRRGTGGCRPGRTGAPRSPAAPVAAAAVVVELTRRRRHSRTAAWLAAAAVTPTLLPPCPCWPCCPCWPLWPCWPCWPCDPVAPAGRSDPAALADPAGRC